MKESQMAHHEDRLHDVMAWAVLDSAPADMPVRQVRAMAERVTSAARALLEEPPLLRVDTETEEVSQVEGSEAHPTIAILRKTLKAVQQRADYDEALGVLVQQALAASEWVEHV